jgi:DNA primase
MPVHEIPKNTQAYAYMASRKFDLHELSEMWGVVYAHMYPVRIGGTDYSWLAGRIFIPCGDGWQARALDDSSRCKYYSQAGWKKSREVYNQVEARKFPFVLVAEGVTDVWRIGFPGVALFGKAASPQQLRVLRSNWTTIGLLLDPDAADDNMRSAAKLKTNLENLVPNVFQVQLPGTKDPAQCEYGFLWDQIEKAAADAKIPGVIRPGKDVNG